MPPAKIIELAKKKVLPRRLASCKVPRCTSCLFSKAIKRPWWTKATVNSFKSPQAFKPGDSVAIDQLVSSVPVLIGQMRGFITKKRYTITTVFVDHYSGLSFVHNQMTSGAQHTIKAKKAFERYALSHGVYVRHYHADNGIFASKEFTAAVARDIQSITFCAVNAHHQNGRAEKRIRDLQDTGRGMVLHAKQRWPKAITANLWPYAIRIANDMVNDSPIQHKDDLPMELFSAVGVAPRINHLHTFGLPVYVLDAKLQAGQRIGKWANRARVGIYLGSSPRHSRKVALVLSLLTGHVYPQFHCNFDNLLETRRASAGNLRVRSRWQEVTGFTEAATVEESTSMPFGDIFLPVETVRTPQQQATVEDSNRRQTSTTDPTESIAGSRR